MEHVLLIEDDQDDQEIFCMALREIDSRIICHTAEDGVQAIEKLKNDPSFITDIIIIDVNMPKLNGISCVYEIKRIPNLKEVPIFMYSTTTEQRVIEESRKLGAKFLVKPISIATLVTNLQALINGKGQ